MKIVPIVAAGFAAFIAAAPAHAALFTESFDEPFAGWESRFFGTLTNATNALDSGTRGNNVTGLSVDDPDRFDGGEVSIVFDAAFAAGITEFAFDVLSYNGQTLSVFDADGAVLLTAQPTPLDAPFDFADDRYTRYTVTSTNGVGGFSFGPFGGAGNVSIDDLSITTFNAVPEPATWAMMIGGFALAGAGLRRQRRTVSFA